MQSQQAGAGPCLTLVPRVVPDLQMSFALVGTTRDIHGGSTKSKIPRVGLPPSLFQLPEHVEHIPISTQFQLLKRMNRYSFSSTYTVTRAPGHPGTPSLPRYGRSHEGGRHRWRHLRHRRCRCGWRRRRHGSSHCSRHRLGGLHGHALLLPGIRSSTHQQIRYNIYTHLCV